MICTKCGTKIVGQPVECPNCGNVVNDNNITYVDGYRMIKNGIFTFLIEIFALFALITGCFIL